MKNKQLGRPREFDEPAVLSAAADIFWLKGYEGTSTRDLTSGTGLTASSMYGAYGDKRGLFHRALDHYLDGTLRDKIARLSALASPTSAIAAFFEDIISRTVRDPERRGCMLVNSVLEASSDQVETRDAIARELAMIEGFFRNRLMMAQQLREIPETVLPEEAARHLLSVLLGIRVLARVRPEHALLTGAVRQALGATGISWPSHEGAGTGADAVPAAQ